ncbi:hypothetical protein BS78_09G087100 [Paspalum vaginatum]|nr:hypothetical protein BS78_09G087100 [Paspalum vaginatum]
MDLREANACACAGAHTRWSVVSRLLLGLQRQRSCCFQERRKGAMWALWKTRNKRTIENNFMFNTKGVMYASVANLQKWSALLKQQEQVKMEETINKMKRWPENFSTNAVLMAEVGEIV